MLWLKSLLFQPGWVMGKRIVVAILLAFIVSSCERKAAGQTVAVVNNEEITAADLNAELASVNVSAAAATKDVRAAALQRIINRRLLEQQAKKDGLDKSPEFLNQQRRMTEELLINMLVSRQMNTAQVPTPEQVSQFEASHPEIFKHEVWTLDQLIFPLPKDPGLKAKLSAAKSLDEIAQALTAAGVQFTKGTKQVDTALFPHQIYTQIAGLSPGEPFLAPGPDKEVANVIAARQPGAPVPDDKARQLALTAMRREQANQFVDDRVKALKATAKIQYQPGFEPPAKSPGL
jgi:peptidyl-prolyl cis-trans isomerase C